MSSLEHDITEPGRPYVQEVSAGVYAYVQPDGTWWINNTGFLTGPQGVISIDTCSTERRTLAYRAGKPWSSTRSCQIAIALRPRATASVMTSRYLSQALALGARALPARTPAGCVLAPRRLAARTRPRLALGSRSLGLSLSRG